MNHDTEIFPLANIPNILPLSSRSIGCVEELGPRVYHQRNVVNRDKVACPDFRVLLTMSRDLDSQTSSGEESS